MLGAPVPTCPGWSTGDLVVHLGAVHRWAAAVVEAGGARVARRDLPAPPAPGDPGLLGWYLESVAALRAVLGATDPAAPAWTWSASSPPARTAGWWVRRQVVETALHRVDVELAAGGPAQGVARPVAAAGLEELLTDLLPGALASGGVDGAALHGTLHLHATDGPPADLAPGDLAPGDPAPGDTVEWLVDLDADPPVATRGHARAAAALRGPASELLLWSHHRAGTGHLEVLGDASVVAGWEAVRL